MEKFKRLAIYNKPQLLAEICPEADSTLFVLLGTPEENDKEVELKTLLTDHSEIQLHLLKDFRIKTY